MEFVDIRCDPVLNMDTFYLKFLNFTLDYLSDGDVYLSL